MRAATIPEKTKKRKSCCPPSGFGDPENCVAAGDPFAGESDVLASLPFAPEGHLAIKGRSAATLRPCGFAGVGGDPEASDSEREIKDRAAIAKASIRRFLQAEGWTEEEEKCRRRDYKRGEGHYRDGIAAKALCGCLPIPSASKSGKEVVAGGRFEKTGSLSSTGQSGMIEIGYSGPDEHFRGVETCKEYVEQFERRVKSGGAVSAGGRMTCKNPLVCPHCAPIRQEEAVGKIKLIVMQTLFSGRSYFFLTIALPHYYSDGRSNELLTKTWRQMVGHRQYKELCKKYGITFIMKSFESTNDNLYYDYEKNKKKKSGSHPHFHGLYQAPHDITEETLEEFRQELNDAIFTAMRKFVDPEWLEKKIPAMRQHCTNIKLYGDYDQEVLDRVEKEWQEQRFDMPAEMKKFKDIHDKNWVDRKEHFIKQLAGISGVAAYISALTQDSQNASLAQEVAKGASKEGREDRRVSVQTYLYQASISKDPEIRKAAFNYAQSLRGVRFCVFPPGWKKRLAAEYRPCVYDHAAHTVRYAVTEKEWENEKKVRAEKPVPTVIRGDRMTLDALPLDEARWRKILAYGEARFNRELGELIRKRQEKMTRKLTRVELAEMYENFAASALSGVLPEKVKIPRNYYDSPCWRSQPWQIPRHESRAAVTRAKLIRQADPKIFCELQTLIASKCSGFVLDLDEDAGGMTKDQKEFFETFDRLGVASVIDRFWRKKGRSVVVSERRRRLFQAPIRQEIIEEDNREFIREKFGDWSKRRWYFIGEGVIPLCSSVVRTLGYFVENRFSCDFYEEDWSLVGEFDGEKYEISADELWGCFMNAIEERQEKKRAVQRKIDQAVQKCAVLAFVAAAARGEIWGVVDRLPLLEKPLPLLEEAVA